MTFGKQPRRNNGGRKAICLLSFQEMLGMHWSERKKSYKTGCAVWINRLRNVQSTAGPRRAAAPSCTGHWWPDITGYESHTAVSRSTLGAGFTSSASAKTA